MKVHYNNNSLPVFKNAVITIGTFDGVHHGHQKLIEKIIQLAKQVKGESVLITFEPHPRIVVFPDDHSLKILSTIEEKILLLENLEVDHLVVIPFNKQFSQLTAKEYVVDFLVGKFNPATIVIGYNHQFGHHRDGNVELLKKLSDQFNFNVEELNKQMIDDIEVSSTRIRIAIQEGDVKTANQLLGHIYSLTGVVVKGNQLGRKLGYPTANVKIEDDYKLIPADGVYAIRCIFEMEERAVTKNAVCSIGYRPTVNGTHRTVEAFIFDFDGNIYNQKLTIEFVERIREEEQFETLDLMVEEIRRDEIKARKILI